MKPIEKSITTTIKYTSEAICTELLNVSRWQEFTGYFILPGIKNAVFERQTSSIVGSRIKVYNTDGSSHVEEIVEWDVHRKVVLKFQNFSTPLNRFAQYFLEEWNFEKSNGDTKVMRKIKIFPAGIIGRIILIPISVLMIKAFERQLNQMDGK